MFEQQGLHRMVIHSCLWTWVGHCYIGDAVVWQLLACNGGTSLVDRVRYCFW
jgi:hypothetical protein